MTPEEYKAHREEKRAYYAANKLRIQKRHAAWQKNKYDNDEAYRAARRAYQATYRANHHELEMQRKKEWQQKNKLARKVAWTLGVNISEARRQLGIEHETSV